MAQWRVFSSDHEIPGQILIDLANAVGADEIMPYFRKHGLSNIDPKVWYPEQQLLNVYSDMANTKDGTMFDFVSIGMKEAEQAVIPPAFLSLPLMANLQGINQVFKLNNRGSDIGEMRCEVVSDKHAKIIVRIPQPDDLWYGIFYGYVKRFSPRGAYFKVYYDETVRRRDEGGEVTIIHITWE